jgi:hypothetical protein
MAAGSKKDTREVEELFKHTIELNKKYINQSFKLINQINQQGPLDKNLFTFKPDLYAKAIKTFSRMNLEYYNKMMDLGFSFADEFLSHQPQADHTEEPSFILEGKGVPGSEVKLQFVLENTRNAEVHCELKNTPFVREEDKQKTSGITTSFDPQAFRQDPGGSHTVSISLTIGKQVIPGKYTTDVSVIGFEPTFFAIVLEVDQIVKTTVNATAKRQSAKK